MTGMARAPRADTLDLYKLIRDGLLRPGQNAGGTLIWTYAGSGERIGAIGYLAILGEERGRMRRSSFAHAC